MLQCPFINLPPCLFWLGTVCVTLDFASTLNTELISVCGITHSRYSFKKSYVGVLVHMYYVNWSTGMCTVLWRWGLWKPLNKLVSKPTDGAEISLQQAAGIIQLELCDQKTKEKSVLCVSTGCIDRNVSLSLVKYSNKQQTVSTEGEKCEIDKTNTIIACLDAAIHFSFYRLAPTLKQGYLQL